MLFLWNTLCKGQYFEEIALQQNIVGSFGYGDYGGGVSFNDFNGDGWDDLTFSTQLGDSIQFYVNQQGTFQKIPSLVTNTDETKQILWVDYDNDGDKDLFVTAFQGTNRLYNNDGFLNLTDVTEAVGLPIIEDPTQGACFGDINNDGWLDLYITNYSTTTEFSNYLFVSKGEGLFEDITESAGVSAGNFSPGFVSSFIDYNSDGLQDIYVVVDHDIFTNILFKNLGNNEFEDVSAQTGTDIGIDGMNLGYGDYDSDGDFDIYVTNDNAGNKLLVNNGNETYTEMSDQAGVAINRIGWAANFLDMDNDLDLDLYVCHYDAVVKKNYLLENTGGGNYFEPLPDGIIGDTLDSYSSAVGDYNNDGLLDIAVSNADSFNFELLKNVQSNANNYLKLNFEGVSSNAEGIGTFVKFYLGAKTVIRYRLCGTGFRTQDSGTLHFGLSQANKVDSIEIVWLSGIRDKLYDVDVNQTLTIVEGSTDGSFYGTDITVEICSDETFFFNGQEYNTTGNYTIYSDGGNDIDSITFINLTVNPSYQTDFTASICEGGGYFFENQIFSTEGIHEVIYPTERGCDSVFVLDLQFLDSYEQDTTVQICEGSSYEFNNETLNSEGLYTAEMMTVDGCDSIIHLSLEVLPHYNIQIEEMICEGDILTVADEEFSESGFYTINLISDNGCDSIISLSLDVFEISDDTIEIEVVVGEIYNGVMINNDTTFTEIYTATNGCDSLITVHAFTITSSNEEFSEIENVQIYPNPFDELIHLRFPVSLPKEFTISLYNTVGEKIQNMNGTTIVNGLEYTIYSKDLTAGIYYLSIQSGDKIFTKKIIKLN
jgi:hypothetical protein